MKHLFLTLLCAAALTPTAASAQTNIVNAFNKLIDCKDAEITEKHKLEKDPSTNQKESMYDIYTFSIPADKKNLIDNIEKAFKEDSDKAYGYYSGDNAKDGEVGVSAGKNTNVDIVVHNKSNYTFALFLDNDREDKDHRYAYGMSYYKDGDKLCGRLVVTYSTTLKHRQGQGAKTTKAAPEKTWFEKFIKEANGLEFVEQNGARVVNEIAVLDRIYGLCEKCESASKTDRETAIAILSAKLKNSKYQNSTVQKLLQGCIENLSQK